MTKRSIKSDTIKFLLLRSGNKCAFPNCNHPIFNDDNLLIAQLCHIESVSSGGQRFNPLNSVKKNNSAENLLFLCYRHHKETDNTELYTVDKLQEIKNNHEKQFSEQMMLVNPNMIKQVEDEMIFYWNRIIQLQKDDETGMIIEIDTNSKFEEIICDIHSYLGFLINALGNLSNSNDNLYNEILEVLQSINYSKAKLESIPYYENPLINRDWELLNIGTFNAISVVKLRLKQLEIKHFEEVVKNNIENKEAKHQLENLKHELEKLVQINGFRD
ncbi:hypothetical protein HX024_12440 [Myroides marinus]|nr:hypothetical protein [Myroides marinus]